MFAIEPSKLNLHKTDYLKWLMTISLAPMSFLKGNLANLINWKCFLWFRNQKRFLDGTKASSSCWTLTRTYSLLVNLHHFRGVELWAKAIPLRGSTYCTWNRICFVVVFTNLCSLLFWLISRLNWERLSQFHCLYWLWPKFPTHEPTRN